MLIYTSKDDFEVLSLFIPELPPDQDFPGDETILFVGSPPHLLTDPGHED